HADASGVDMYAAIDLLVDKLDRQLPKQHKKQTDHPRGANPARDGRFGCPGEHAMPCTDLLSADRIVVLDEPGSPARVLAAAAELLAGGPGAAATGIAEALGQRERLGSTAIGHGVAIPHARSDAFPAARGAFLRLGR